MQAIPRIPVLPKQSFFTRNRWFSQMYLAELLYHPDDPGETTVNIASGQPTFTPEECIELNKTVGLMFDHRRDKGV